MSITFSPLTIVGHEEDTNLLHVCWNQRFLEKEARYFKLQHGEAVVYTNVARDRVRLVAVFYGMAVLILPPIDPQSKISLYMKINEFLRQFQAEPKVTSFLEGEVTEARERLKRQEERKKLAANAAKRRKKKT
jgi:hypothetical protein